MNWQTAYRALKSSHLKFRKPSLIRARLRVSEVMVPCPFVIGALEEMGGHAGARLKRCDSLSNKRDAAREGFTLLELLVVVACVGILASMLLPALSRAKEAGQSARCISNLRQMGIGLQMYVDDYRYYPAWWDDGPRDQFGDQALFHYWFAVAYSQLNNVNLNFETAVFTNRSLHCPSYFSEGGNLEIGAEYYGSYSYNALGGTGYGMEPWYGLGNPEHPTLASSVLMPSEMFEVSDSRPGVYSSASYVFFAFTNQVAGETLMNFYLLSVGPAADYYSPPESAPTHGARTGYNTLYVDGHVDFITRRNFLYPPVAYPHWNTFYDANPGWWLPISDWAVTK